MKTIVLFIIKVIIIVVLSVIFILCFGFPKLKSYLENENIVIETIEEDPDDKAFAPGITVCASHTGHNAWKYERQVCNGTSGDILLQCFLNSTYSKNEVLTSITGENGRSENWKYSLDIREDFIYYVPTFGGLIHEREPPLR